MRHAYRRGSLGAAPRVPVSERRHGMFDELGLAGAGIFRPQSIGSHDVLASASGPLSRECGGLLPRRPPVSGLLSMGGSTSFGEYTAGMPCHTSETPQRDNCYNGGGLGAQQDDGLAVRVERTRAGVAIALSSSTSISSCTVSPSDEAASANIAAVSTEYRGSRVPRLPPECALK
jgi:hypothetical protein